ncbi:hypothetical protein [Neptuniibacter sp.]|uniref:hypothetical protein n=1 Tax=Neptuniibacter sp. TaxID=1962643 RepID=UPI0026353806|nr:hypothetical protein [Neptuniibacter sp.]MCP4595024.1 hypothetical protein [Neptuniibacter sp.]
MLTYQECVDMSGLTPGEVSAIAEHEHVDSIIAVAMGNYLVEHEGEKLIKKIILDDIAKAERSGDEKHAEVLRKVMQHFIATHPDNG